MTEIQFRYGNSSMTSWWYAENGQQFGPIDQNSLTQHFRAGKIAPQTLVWREGMTQWQNLASVPELRILLAPPIPAMPPIPQQAPPPTALQVLPHAPLQARPAAPANTYAANYGQPYQSPQAMGATQQAAIAGNVAVLGERYFARCFDFWIGLFVLLVPYLMLFILGFGQLLNEHTVTVVLLLTLLSFVVDALIYAIFGNTMGKALLGLRVVRNDGSKPDAAHYFLRNLQVWLRGYAMGIPPFSFFMLLIQANRINKTQTVSYDRSSGDQVITVPVSFSRKAIFTILYSVMATFFIVSFVRPYLK
jgi:uncharacterized RDD family membrane protein YckC